MSHVLVHGTRSDCERLRSLLAQRGWTVGSAPALDGGRPRPTVQECDAVIFLGDGAALLGAGPDGVEGPAVAPAPLLFVARAEIGDPAEVMFSDTREPLADLETALEVCRLRACALRGALCGAAADGRLRDQLGHELRSPLAALKTALELLSDQQPAPDRAAAGADPARERILDIARRNVQRLHRAVEWSEVVLGAATPAAASPGPASAAETAEEPAAGLLVGTGA